MPRGISGETALTEQAIDEVRQRMGDVHEAKPWWHVATRDAIRVFTEGYGDNNPLYTDPDYAADSGYGGVIAPPSFLYCGVSGGGSTGGVGLPGAFALHAEDDWEWHATVTEGTEIHGVQRLVEVEEKSSRWAGYVVHQVLQTDFFNGDGVPLGIYRMRVVRGDRKHARSSQRYVRDGEETPRISYSDDQLDMILDDYEREVVRGAEPRYYEDVSVGDDLGHVVKGPLSVRDIICWWMGRGAPLMKAFGNWERYVRERPGVAIIDPETNLRETPEAAHYDERLARRSGVAGPYDTGHMRTTWCLHLLTNWGGDDSFVRSARVRILRPNYVGNTCWVRGTVTDLEEREGRGIAACSLVVENQNGEINATGQATIQLPRRVRG